MAMPRIWGPDEFNEGRGASNVPQDGDLKVTWPQPGTCALWVRVGGQWQPILGTDGKVPADKLPSTLSAVQWGTAPGTACQGNDARLSDARPPLAHAHAISGVTNLQEALDAKASTSHAHAQSDVTGLVTALAGKAAVSHSHTVADVLLLQAALDARAPLAHGHAVAEVTGLQLDLDAKQAASAKGQPNGYAALDGTGKVPSAQLPPAGGGWWSVVHKAADTTRVNATLASDPDLQFAMDAASRYVLRGRVYFDTGATADFKWRHAGPASPALVRISRSWILPGATALAGVAVDAAFSAADLALAGTGTNGGWVDFDGVVTTVAAGTFAFQWAQNTATAGQNTTVRAGSYLEYRKL